jgi:hypothetical protein
MAPTLPFGNRNEEPSSPIVAGFAKHWQSQWHPASGGHRFPAALDEPQKRAVLEYLKTS